MGSSKAQAKWRATALQLTASQDRGQGFLGHQPKAQEEGPAGENSIRAVISHIPMSSHMGALSPQPRQRAPRDRQVSPSRAPSLEKPQGTGCVLSVSAPSTPSMVATLGIVQKSFPKTLNEEEKGPGMRGPHPQDWPQGSTLSSRESRGHGAMLHADTALASVAGREGASEEAPLAALI